LGYWGFPGDISPPFGKWLFGRPIPSNGPYEILGGDFLMEGNLGLPNMVRKSLELSVKLFRG